MRSLSQPSLPVLSSHAGLEVTLRAFEAHFRSQDTLTFHVIQILFLRRGSLKRAAMAGTGHPLCLARMSALGRPRRFRLRFHTCASCSP